MDAQLEIHGRNHPSLVLLPSTQGEIRVNGWSVLFQTF